MQLTDSIAVLVLTMAVSLVATFVPVRRINRIDPAMVFRA
jgi:ABC-type lipoprotein release transport system permease subunit